MGNTITIVGAAEKWENGSLIILLILKMVILI